MISLKRLVMDPYSPDKAIKQGRISESALARIAHVNRLSKDVNDILYYEIDPSVNSTLRIRSKKGIVKVLNPTTTNIQITLQNVEIPIQAEPEKIYVQLTITSDGGSSVLIYGIGLTADNQYTVELRTLSGVTWGNVYFQYDIVVLE